MFHVYGLLLTLLLLFFAVSLPSVNGKVAALSHGYCASVFSTRGFDGKSARYRWEKGVRQVCLQFLNLFSLAVLYGRTPISRGWLEVQERCTYLGNEEKVEAGPIYTQEAKDEGN